MAVELEGLEFKVEGLAGDGVKTIKDLATALSGLKSALPSKAKISGVTQSLQQLNGVNVNGDNADKLTKLADALSQLNASKISSTIGKNIESIGSAIRTITDGDISRIRDLSDAMKGLQGIGNIRVSLPSGGNATATGQSAVDQAMPDIGSSVENAKEKFGSFFKIDTSFFDTVKLGAQTAAHGLGEFAKAAGKVSTVGLKGLASFPAFFGKRLANSIGQATGKLGGLLAGLKRIAMYRAMRTVIKMFTEGLSEGLKNLYAYSQQVGGQFSASMDRIATSSLYLKNSLGAMAAPLVNALAPAIDFVIDKFVSLLNVVNMFIAKLTGSDTATIAKKSFTQWGEDADKSAKKTKKAVDKLKRTILGFDEINKLNGSDSSGDTGGGGGGGGADVGSMFEKVPIDSAIGDFADRLKELFKQQKWADIGIELGNKVNEIIEQIPWEKIGTKIGKFANAAITIAYYFLKTVSFVNLGKKVAKLFNNALTQINTNTLGRLLVRAFTILPSLLIGAITEVDWGLVAEKLSDFVIGCFDEASDWLEEVDWAELANTLTDNLIKFVKKVKWRKIARAIGRFLGSAVGAIASVLVTLGLRIGRTIIKGIQKAKAKANELKKWLKEKVVKPIKEGAKKGDLLGGLKTAGKNIVEGIWKGIKKVTWKIWDLIGEPFVKAFKKTFKISDEDGATLDSIVNLGKNIWEGIKNGIKEKIEALGKFWDWVKGLLFGSDNPSDDTTLASANVGIGLKQEGWTTVKKWFEGLGAAAVHVVSVGVELFKKGWETVRKWIFGDNSTDDGITTKVNLTQGDTWNSEAYTALTGKIPDPANRSVGIGKKTGSWFTNAYTVLTGKIPGEDSRKVGIGTGKSWAASAYTALTGKIPGEGSRSVGIATGSTWASQAYTALTRSIPGAKSRVVGIIARKGKNWISKAYTVLTKGMPGDASRSVGIIQKASQWVSSAYNALTAKPPKSTTREIGLKKGTFDTEAKTVLFAPKEVNVSAKVNLTKGFTSLQQWFNTKLTGAAHVLPSVNAKLVLNAVSFVSGLGAKIVGWVKNLFNNAEGGVYSSGAWHRIPQYATGGIPNHGTMFVAGEAGAEVVGTINGRTEVLNASQIASAIHSAVLSAMQQANARQMPMINVTVRTQNDEVLARAVARGQKSLDSRFNPTAGMAY